jgi:hypothetical protein
VRQQVADLDSRFRAGCGTGLGRACDASSKSIAGVELVLRSRTSPTRRPGDAQRPGTATGHTRLSLRYACRAMLASGKASTNRPPFNPDGKLATWALNGLAWSIVPLCILLLCVIGRTLTIIRGTGGPPVRWFVILSSFIKPPAVSRQCLFFLSAEFGELRSRGITLLRFGRFPMCDARGADLDLSRDLCSVT